MSALLSLASAAYDNGRNVNPNCRNGAFVYDDDDASLSRHFGSRVGGIRIRIIIIIIMAQCSNDNEK